MTHTHTHTHTHTRTIIHHGHHHAPSSESLDPRWHNVEVNASGTIGLTTVVLHRNK